MNKLTDIHTFFDKNTTLIFALRNKLNYLLSFVDGLTDKTYSKRINELLQYLNGYELYNNIVKCSNKGLVNINLYDLFKVFHDSCNSGINKNKKNNIYFFVDGEPINHKEVNILSEAFTIHNCLPIMEIIPTLLLDNALKYAISGTEINIYIEKTNYGKKLSVENIGPKLDIDEQNSIFSLYRGRNAKATKIQGQGIGLKIVHQIFMAQKWLNTDIGIFSSESNVIFNNNIPYSKFVISLFYDDSNMESFSSEDIKISSADCINFITHEFIRIYPKLCKSCIALYSRSISNNKEINNNDEFQNLCYEIKDIIFEFYIILILHDADFLNTDEKAYDQSIKFDKNLINEVKYLCNIKGISIETIITKGFNNIVMCPPLIDLFFHIFAKDLICASHGEDLYVNVDQEYIEFSKNDNFSTGIKRIDILNQIISSYGIELFVHDNIIEISKL
ncbi:MAG: sensor histidine kinase [Bacteroidales bacterium]|nr:sensor histidine kinase [Bacteroidales bacterium]